jgi:hypothetical protein
MLENSWVAADLAAPQEGLSSISKRTRRFGNWMFPSSGEETKIQFPKRRVLYYLEFRTMKKNSKNPVILCVHHRQNPLESTRNYHTVVRNIFPCTVNIRTNVGQLHESVDTQVRAFFYLNSSGTCVLQYCDGLRAGRPGFDCQQCKIWPITAGAQSKTCTVFVSSNYGIVGSNPNWGMDVCVRSLCAGSGPEMGWSPIQGVLPTV